MGYHCVRPSILFYLHGPANLHFFESLKYHKITQIQNGHLNFCSQRGIRSLADIAEHICQIKRRSDGNCFLKRANKHFFVSGHSNERVDDMGIKMSPKQFASGMGWLGEV